MWSIWLRSEISSEKDFEILWKIVIFQIFISTVLTSLSTVLMFSPNSPEANPHCTEGIPPLYWRYPPTVLNTLHSTDVIPLHVLKVSPQCTEYPPQYWSYPPTVLMLSPTVLILSPHMYWFYPPYVLMLSPTVLNNPHSTEAVLHSNEAIPHCTEQPPQYWSYPPQDWSYPPRAQYWCYPPRCTEQPPLYWTTSTVRNNLHSTKLTLYGVIIAMHLRLISSTSSSLSV